jgi:hypothetical protein
MVVENGLTTRGRFNLPVGNRARHPPVSLVLAFRAAR